MAAGSEGVNQAGGQAKRFAAGGVGLADEQNLAVAGDGSLELGQKVGQGLPLWIKSDMGGGAVDLGGEDTSGRGLLNKLEKESFDVAVGSRAAEGAEEGKKSMLRKILSGGLRWIVRHIFFIPVKDTQCGFKMYTREAAQKLHTKQTIMGFSFDLEILYLASKFGYKIAEVPVSWIDAPGSKVDTRKEVQRFLRDLMTVKMNDLKGVYR